MPAGYNAKDWSRSRADSGGIGKPEAIAATAYRRATFQPLSEIGSRNTVQNPKTMKKGRKK
jgi:hypothetical protein